MTAGTMGASCLPRLKIPVTSTTASVNSHSTNDTRSRVGSLFQLAPQRPQLALITSIVLVMMVVLEFVTDPQEAHELSFRVVTLVFPSQQITWIKVVCVTVGLCLSSSYFVSSRSQLATAEHLFMHSAQALVSPFSRSRHNSETASNIGENKVKTPTGTMSASWLTSRCQSLLRTNHFADETISLDHDEVPQLKVRDECRAARETPVPLSASSHLQMVNGKQPLPFESEYFFGHVLFMVNTMNHHSHPSDPGQSSHWGHLFANKKRMLWVQVQGQFRKLPPEKSAIFIATELPKPDGFQVAFLTKQLVTLLITLVKKFVPTAHISFGEKPADPKEHELPHAAFPLYQTVDEYVVTENPVEGTGTEPAVPVLGQEHFGESQEQKRARQTTVIGKEPPIRLNATYTFQFYTMYSDLAQWKIVNVPGMPDMHLSRFCGTQPIQLAAYVISVPLNHPVVLPTRPHKLKDKAYLYCFSMNPTQTTVQAAISSPQPKGVTTTAHAPTQTLSSTTATSVLSHQGEPGASTLVFANRWRSASCDLPPVLARQHEEAKAIDRAGGTYYLSPTSSLSALTSPSGLQLPMQQPRIRAPSMVRKMTTMERAEDLAHWTFTLPLWIECVDAAAGKRKVAYLLTVQPKEPKEPSLQPTHSSHHRRRRCVIRSAATVKSALLLLDSSREQASSQSRHVTDEKLFNFRKLIIESREFQYATISHETELVHQHLQRLASSIVPVIEDTFEKKAMLYNCLMSEAELQCIRSFQSIGVQLSNAKRDQMDIIYEKGVYRMIQMCESGPTGATTSAIASSTTTDMRFLRQEWFILTTSELLFYRSFTLRPCKSVPIALVLSVQAVDNVPFLSDNVPPTASSTPTSSHRATNRWYCLQMHMLTEVVTVFVDNAVDRMLWIQSLNQLIKLNTGNPSSTRLSTTLAMDSLTSPVCLNHRNPLGSYSKGNTATEEGLQLPKTNSIDDSLSMIQSGVKLVEEILVRGLVVFNSPRLELKPSCLLAFLNAVECLNTLSWDTATSWLENDDAKVAFALNLYHVLCIHTWVVYGDVTTHVQWKRIKSFPYYSIGSGHQGLQVTLAELEYIVLRGTVAPVDDSLLSAKNRAGFQCMIPTHRDLRTTFALHLNSSRSIFNSNGTRPHLIKVYHGQEDADDPRTNLNSELAKTCATFLQNDVIIDDITRTITLPKLCELNADDYVNRVTHAVPVGSKAFYCLQKLIPLMHIEQQEHVQHLLLGAGNEAAIKYNTRFWTQTVASISNSVTIANNSQVLSRVVSDTTDTPMNTKIPRNNSALEIIRNLF